MQGPKGSRTWHASPTPRTRLIRARQPLHCTPSWSDQASMASTMASMPAHHITDVGWQGATSKYRSGFMPCHTGPDLRWSGHCHRPDPPTSHMHYCSNTCRGGLRLQQGQSNHCRLPLQPACAGPTASATLSMTSSSDQADSLCALQAHKFRQRAPEALMQGHIGAAAIRLSATPFQFSSQGGHLSSQPRRPSHHRRTRPGAPVPPSWSPPPGGCPQSPAAAPGRSPPADQWICSDRPRIKVGQHDDEAASSCAHKPCLGAHTLPDPRPLVHAPCAVKTDTAAHQWGCPVIEACWCCAQVLSRLGTEGWPCVNFH